jgi:hypothetical protein
MDKDWFRTFPRVHELEPINRQKELLSVETAQPRIGLFRMHVICVGGGENKQGLAAAKTGATVHWEITSGKSS